MNKIVILAAGKGTRMKDELPKVLVPLKGKPMIEYLIKSIFDSGVDNNPVIVVSLDNKELINNALKNYDCKYAPQDKQLGTGHALACVKDLIDESADNIIVLYGDHPFIKPKTIKELIKVHTGKITMMTTEVEDFNDWRKNYYSWGRIIKEGEKIKAIKEFKDASEEEKKIKELNPAFYCFSAEWLWKNIKKLENNNAQKEYYLTDLIKIASEQNIKISSIKINFNEAIGINSKEELEIAEKLI